MCFFYNFIRFLGIYALFLQPEYGKREQSVICDAGFLASFVFLRENKKYS